MTNEVNELKQVRKELIVAQAAAEGRTLEELEATKDIESHTELTSGGVMDKTAPLEGGEKSAADPNRRILGLTERFQKLAEQHQELANIEDELMTEGSTATSIPALAKTTSLSHVGDPSILRHDGSHGTERPDATTIGVTPSSTGPSSFDEEKEMDDGTRFGVGSDFSKDAKRDDMFLSNEMHVPAPRLLSLHDVAIDMREELENEAIPDFLGEFEDKVPEEELVIAKIPIEELEKKERMIEEVRIKQAQEEASKYRKRELDLAWREHASRTRIAVMEVQTRKRLHGLKKKVRRKKRHWDWQHLLLFIIVLNAFNIISSDTIGCSREHSK